MGINFIYLYSHDYYCHYGDYHDDEVKNMVSKGMRTIEVSEKRHAQLKNAKKVFACGTFDEVIEKLQKYAIPHMLDSERYVTKDELVKELM